MRLGLSFLLGLFIGKTGGVSEKSKGRHPELIHGLLDLSTFNFKGTKTENIPVLNINLITAMQRM